MSQFQHHSPYSTCYFFPATCYF